MAVGIMDKLKKMGRVYQEAKEEAGKGYDNTPLPAGLYIGLIESKRGQAETGVFDKMRDGSPARAHALFVVTIQDGEFKGRTVFIRQNFADEQGNPLRSGPEGKTIGLNILLQWLTKINGETPGDPTAIPEAVKATAGKVVEVLAKESGNADYPINYSIRRLVEEGGEVDAPSTPVKRNGNGGLGKPPPRKR